MRALWIPVVTCCGLSLLACGDDGADGPAVGDGDMADSGMDGPHGDGDGDGEPVEIDRSRYADVGTDAPLDYADMGHWACHPQLANSGCDADIDATEVEGGEPGDVVPHEPAEDPGFDCFYVYPTVVLTGDPNMIDFSDTGMELVRDPLLSQAARFSSLCRMYAPLYRQIGLNGVNVAEGADSELALQDVRDAFAHYLEHDNDDRPFVLLGHSQGTFMLTSMIQMDVDNVAEVRERMLSAVLLGGRVEVPEGQDVGGSFENIPLCKAPGDTGCVIAYVSFAADTPADAEARFGVAETAGNEVACTNPAELAGNDGLLKGGYYPQMVNNASFRTDAFIPEGIDTPFMLYRGILSSRCAKNDSASFLEISTELPMGDMGLPPYRSAIEGIGWGLHLTDFNNTMSDLLDAVALQAESMGL